MRYEKLIIRIIKIYQKYISSYTMPRCKFYPTCSNYAILAYKKHGFIKATFLVIVRICKCNPFFKGGYDPLK